MRSTAPLPTPIFLAPPPPDLHPAAARRSRLGQALAIAACIVAGPILTVHLFQEASRLTQWGGC